MKASSCAAGLIAALLAWGCRDAAPARGAAREAQRASAAERETFRPPEDGVLTAAQVEAFLKVREATVRVLATPGGAAPLEGDEGISDATEARAAEIRAARSLSVPVGEYFWVRERILEAEAAAQTAKLNADVLGLLDRTLGSLRARRTSAPDDASRQLLDAQIASFEAEAARVRREAAEKEPEAIRANLKVLGSFRPKLSAIADELAALRLPPKPAEPPAQ